MHEDALKELQESRFIILSSDAFAKLHPEHWYSKGDLNFGWCVYDTLTKEFVGCDGGEPEDQLLVRDWSWVVDALNRVASEHK